MNKVRNKIKSFFITAFGDVKEAFRLIGRNFRPIALYALLFAVVGTMCISSFHDLMSKLDMKLIGMQYVTHGSISTYLKSPVTFVCYLILFAAGGYISVVEIGGLVFAIRQSKIDGTATLRMMLEAGINDAGRFLHPRNWIIMPFIMVFMPFVKVFSLMNLSIRLDIPGFIDEFIKADTLYAPLFIILMAVLTFLAFRWIYSVRIFADTDLSFIQSCKKSAALMKRRYTVTVLTMLLLEGAVCTVLYGGAGAIAVASYKARAFLNRYSTVDGSALNMASDIISFAHYVIAYVLPSFNLALLSAMYYRICREEHIPYEASIEFGEAKRADKIKAIAVCLILAVALISQSGYHFKVLHASPHRPEIIAHRGDSSRCPENTMPAFELAIDEGVSDWIELDIHETKDGVIIVSHDDDMSRVLRTKMYVHEKTYDELVQMDAGSWFDKEFAGTKLSTLGEVLDVCKGKIKVQIEIKPTQYDVELEEKVLAITKEHGMEDDVVFTSLKAQPLRRIKELDPDAITVYSTAICFGDVKALDFADYMTIEESNVEPQFVNEMHEEGRKVFVWTVNKPDTVQYLVDCGVDGILTDDPIMLYSALESADYSRRILNRMVVLMNSWQLKLY